MANVQLFWSRSGTGCTVALYTDDDGRLGEQLGAAALPAGDGWVTAPLAAALAADTPYHLAVACDDAGRLATVRGVAGDGADTVRLERVRHGQVRARAGGSPRFVLTFADGSWWGQPYRPGKAVRLCGGDGARQAFVATNAAQLTGVDVAVRGAPRRARVDLELAGADGAVLLTAPLAHHRTAGGHHLRPPVAIPLALDAGGTYTVALHARAKAGRCVDLVTRETELTLGRPLAGLALGNLATTADGTTWTAHPSALSLALVNQPTPPSGTTDPSPPPVCTGDRCQPREFRSTYVSGYFGAYDAATIPLWPKRMGVVLGEANSQGPLVADAKRAAAAAGNGDARFVFYFSLTSLDSQCDCFDQRFYDAVVAAHPDWLLRDAGGHPLSTFVYEIGAQRQFAVDIGNPAFIDAWADYAIDAMTRYGWDGVWIDNVLRGNFYGWSGTPVNPRTAARYTSEDYRKDILRALQRLRQRLDARGKIMIGNHAAAWEADTFADPVVQQQVTTMHGLEIEDCVYDFYGAPHSEASWIAQVRYLDFANRHGVLTQCRGGNGTLADAGKREYIVASYLLTKEGLSNVGQLNHSSAWWDVLGVDLGAPESGFVCLDPASGLAQAADCPSAGKVYQRDWANGRVLVNPTADRTVTVPLHATFVRGGASVTAVTLPPHSGAILQRP